MRSMQRAAISLIQEIWNPESSLRSDGQAGLEVVDPPAGQ